MCTVCGCAPGETKIEGHDHTHEHDHSHDHSHDHIHKDGHTHHYGCGPAHAHAPGLSQSRMVEIEQNILGKNDAYAAENRKSFDAKNIFVLNLVSSPGSGKTTLLTETLTRMKESHDLAVIEGDQQTANDADRIRATNVPALQINTGKGCHLDAHMVGHGIESLGVKDNSVLFIENVGNLVCPAGFDLGEAHKVVILSVTEGEDKPLKYPDMFAAADIMILTKTDLLPYLDFDVDACVEAARKINPNIQLFQLSSKSGDGMDQWCDWISDQKQQIAAQTAAQ
jgi:hydrogenase nickel incorporation protein HypB